MLDLVGFEQYVWFSFAGAAAATLLGDAALRGATGVVPGLCTASSVQIMTSIAGRLSGAR